MDRSEVPAASVPYRAEPAHKCSLHRTDRSLRLLSVPVLHTEEVTGKTKIRV